MESDHLQQFLAEIEERICTCGAGNGSGEGHTDWCEWVDAERALAVVKEYLTDRRPSEQAVTEAMVEAVVQAVRPYTMQTLFIDEHRELVRDALKVAQEGK